MNPKYVFFLYNASLMMSALFIPNYTRALGGSMVEVGLVGAAYGFSLFFSSYFFGRLSDTLGRTRFIASGFLVAAFAFFLQPFTHTPLQLLGVRALVGFSLGIFSAPLTSYAHERGEKLGNFTSYGSLGWAAGVLLAGGIAQVGESWLGLAALAPYHTVFFLSAALLVFSFLFSRGYREDGFKSSPSPFFPKIIFMKNARVYLSFFLRTLGAFCIWSIFPLYLANIGANKFWIGALFFINAMTQTVVMRRVSLSDDVKLIQAGLLLSTLVFFSYTLAADFRWVLPLQILLAVSFSFMYVGALQYLANRNEEKGLALGLLNSIMGICIGVGPLLGGSVAHVYGFHGPMYLGGLLALAGFAVMAGEKGAG